MSSDPLERELIEDGPTDPWQLSRISWGSVWAGAFVALAVHLVLSLIALSFGVRLAPSYAGADRTVVGISTAAGVVWAVSVLISLWLGGWLAGRTAGHGYGNIGGLHGVVVWGVVTVLLFAFVAHGHGWHALRADAAADPLEMERMARSLRVVSSWSFLVLAIGAFAAGWGGRCGARHVAAFHRLS